MTAKPATSSNGRLLVACLILSPLLCHGIYGAGHQLAPAREEAREDSVHEPGEKDAHPAGRLSGMAYATVLLVFFVAAAAVKPGEGRNIPSRPSAYLPKLFANRESNISVRDSRFLDLRPF